MKKTTASVQTKEKSSKPSAKVLTISQALGDQGLPRLESLKNSQVLGKVFIIKDFSVGMSDYGQFYLVKIEIDEKEKTWITSAQLIVQQLDRLREHLPVQVRLDKIKRSYILIDPH